MVLNAIPPGGDAINPLFQINKPYRCGCCCCSPKQCIGRNLMEVFIGGAYIGSIQENCKCNCNFSYSVLDENDNVLVLLERCCCMCVCADVEFQIFTPDLEPTGSVVAKKFSGIFKELFTTNDNFLVQFPKCMNTVQKKILLIASSMMIEFKHFEDKNKNN